MRAANRGAVTLDVSRWYRPPGSGLGLGLGLGPRSRLPFAAPAHAESWCAYPLWVHEWGVHVFASDGQPTAVEGLAEYFHTPTGGARSDAQKAVRNLPADSGTRALPVLHF